MAQYNLTWQYDKDANAVEFVTVLALKYFGSRMLKYIQL